MLEERTEHFESRREISLEVPAAISDRGCERELNEDRYAIVESNSGTAWLICDGMGGVVGGDLAAQLAVDAMRRVLDQADQFSSEEALRTAVEEANRVIVLRRQNPAFSKMGTTVVAVIENQGQYDFVSVGDSRAYLVRGHSIEQLTHDHTYVQQLVDEGKLTKEEALDHPQGHVLTRCLGASPQLRPDFSRYWCWPLGADEMGDKIVLCSDGLYSLVDDQEIADAVSSLSPQESCAQLTESAKERGGHDNITIIVIPVAGRLAEEQPDTPVQRNKRRVVKRKAASKQSMGKVIFIMGMMFFVGLVSGFVHRLVSLVSMF